jgi:hypothetical protein
MPWAVAQGAENGRRDEELRPGLQRAGVVAACAPAPQTARRGRVKRRLSSGVVPGMSPASSFVASICLYLEVGLVIGVLFAGFGVARVVPAAAGGSPLFRLLIVPGAALLWPLVAVRWIRSSTRRPA